MAALDGYPLGARSFEPAEPSGRTLIIVPGLGLRASFYDPLAIYFAQRGFFVLSFDYRGIGESRSDSLPNSKVTLLDWGRLDFGGALQYVLTSRPKDQVFVLAHSTGGMFVGMAPECDRIDGLVAVAAQPGYWRLWPGVDGKITMAALSWLVIPALVGLFGYLPARTLGWGDDCPGSLAQAWARWVRYPDYVFGFPDELGPVYFE